MIRQQVDVLIIGGGLAGLMAAVSAHEHTKNILLVSKGKVARSGNTLVSGGGISGALGSDTGTNNTAEFYADIIKSGKGLANTELARILAAESGKMVEKLYSYGVQFVKEADGSFRVRRPPGHSVPRNIPTKWDGIAYANRGLSFSLPVYQQCQAKNIPIMEGWSLVELLKNEAAVCGAIFTNSRHEQLLVRAKSVVLASGGYGFLFAKTNNTNDIVGEGIAAALRAGCRVRDMEQVQFYPTMMFEPVKITASNPLFGEGAVLRNRNGEQFMYKYDQAGDMATRDNMARGIFLEIQAGLGIEDSVYFDCTGINREKLLARFGNFYEFLKNNGLDMSSDYLKVSPCVHYTLGGIVIDADCRTDVVGLYAAGEIAGGIHGANRLSGAALMETCVFGWRAGLQAALHSCGTQSLVCPPEPAYGLGNIAIDRLKELRQIMWQHVSLLRTQTSLEHAKAELQALELRAPGLKSAILVCKTVIEAALLRRESRGAHCRGDYRDQATGAVRATVCKLGSSGSIATSWLDQC